MVSFSQLLIATSVVFIARFVWRRLKSPNRTILTTFLDTICDLPAALQIGPWRSQPNIHNAISKALSKSSLKDFGSENNDWVLRYDVTRQIGQERSGSRFSPVGHLIISQFLTKRVEDRLRLVEFFKRHPSIDEIQLRPPVFVVGFVRTGTTFLHEMLGLHESVRSHYTWEQLDCVPSTDDESVEAQNRDRERRYDANKAQFNLLFKSMISDKIQAIHRIAYDEPEECTIPLAFELPWGLTELPFMMYAADKVFNMGADGAFEFYNRFLKLMTWQSGDRRSADFTWMLKCPFHLPYLESLYQAFPGATVVWTHRDPAECVASGCSLFETIMHMGMEEESVDAASIGRAAMEYTKLSLAKAEETLERLGKSVRIVHVRYVETVKDSKGTVRRVLEQANIPFTDAYEASLDEYLRRNAEQRRAMKEKSKGEVLHAYRPEDYGLTTEQIHTEFADYISKYRLLEK